jgi:hypothetical protein
MGYFIKPRMILSGTHCMDTHTQNYGTLQKLDSGLDYGLALY